MTGGLSQVLGVRLMGAQPVTFTFEVHQARD
jgi:hypothetical protein